MTPKIAFVNNNASPRRGACSAIVAAVRNGLHPGYDSEAIVASEARAIGAVSDDERRAHATWVEAIAQHRDETAFANLFAVFAPRLKGYLLRLGLDAGQAEETAQEVMATVWRKADSFDRRQASVSTWVFRIARNRRIDLYRQGRRASLDPDEPLLAPAALVAADVAMEVEQREAALRAALTDLPADQLAVVRQAFYEGLSHSEIAVALGVPLGTVKSRLRLAFMKLKARMEDKAQ
jgi:RNA polymerase sigma-70 factor (ECF subfamily)